MVISQTFLKGRPMNKSNSVFVFTRFGLGHAAEDLQKTLVGKFLSLTLLGELPAKILFYTDGVKLACTGSPVIEQLHQMENAGVELIVCSTCLDYFKLRDKLMVGIAGGMPDIIETMTVAGKVISL
jgi:hypothetical protein